MPRDWCARDTVKEIKSMKKMILLISLAILIVLAAACNGGETATPEAIA